MKSQLIEAFRLASDGWSSDRVIADPSRNALFIEACRRSRVAGSAAELNRALLNVRKRGHLPNSTKRTRVAAKDAYAFAAEIAIRSLERKHRTTLDWVLCDPNLAEEFDAVAGAIAPGFSPLEYRWAALRLRKTKKLRPEVVGRAVPSRVCGPVAVADLEQESVPRQQGLYVFTTRDKVLYVGEAKNLFARIKKHLEHSDNRFLARYIWEFGSKDLYIEYHVLPEDTRADVRKALELELIRSRRAEFNVQR